MIVAAIILIKDVWVGLFVNSLNQQRKETADQAKLKNKNKNKNTKEKVKTT